MRKMQVMINKHNPTTLGSESGWNYVLTFVNSNIALPGTYIRQLSVKDEYEEWILKIRGLIEEQLIQMK